MNMNNLPTELFDLLESKSFAQLTTDQRKMVLEHMTESEFTEQGLVILEFQSVDDQLSFNENAAFIAPKKESIIKRIISYRIPVYQVAAGLALLAMVTFGIQQSSSDTINIGYDGDRYPGQSVADGYYPDSLVFNL